MYSARSVERRASACDDSSAGMIPSVRRSRAKASSASSSVHGGRSRGRCRGASACSGPDARVVEARPRSSARRRSGRPRRRGSTSAAVEDARPARRRGDAAPAASTPTSRTSASSRKPANIPIAFEPPPTQATTASGSRPSAREQLLTGLAADHRLELAHELRIRGRPDARADQVVGRLDVRDPVADRLARRLLERPRAELDRRHLAPSRRIRSTFGAWRRMSSAPM